MLDLLGYSLLLLPFAFFWCCCGDDCASCHPSNPSPDTIDVQFGSMTDGTFCAECADISSIVYTVPRFDACSWSLSPPNEDQVCLQEIEGEFFGIPTVISIQFNTATSGQLNVTDFGSTQVGQWFFAIDEVSGGLGKCTADSGDPPIVVYPVRDESFTGWDDTWCDWYNSVPVVTLG